MRATRKTFIYCLTAWLLSGCADKSVQTLPAPVATIPAGIVIDLLDADLSQWEVWIGVPHSSVQGLPKGTPHSADVTQGTPMGLDSDVLDIFTTFEEEGETILHVSGEIYGGLTTKAAFRNYHLQMQAKWGDKKWEPRLNDKRDSGLLYHCQGEHGAFWKVWKSCLEYQIQESDFGDFIPLAGVKASFRGTLEGGNPKYDPTASTYVKSDGHYISAIKEPDSPHGEWTKVDLYVFEDRAIHVVNDEVVFALKDALTVDDRPLVEGQIQLQSEAAEVFYKDITLRTIEALPADLIASAD